MIFALTDITGNSTDMILYHVRLKTYDKSRLGVPRWGTRRVAKRNPTQLLGFTAFHPTYTEKFYYKVLL